MLYTTQLQKRKEPSKKTYYDLKEDIKDIDYDPSLFYKRLKVLLIRPQETSVINTFGLYFLPMKFTQYFASITWLLVKQVGVSKGDFLDLACGLYSIFMKFQTLFTSRNKAISIQELRQMIEIFHSVMQVLEKYSKYLEKFEGILKSFEEIKIQINKQQWGITQAFVAGNLSFESGNKWKEEMLNRIHKQIALSKQIMNIDFVLLKKSSLLNQVINSTFSEVFNSLNGSIFFVTNWVRNQLLSQEKQGNYDTKMSMSYLNSSSQKLIQGFCFLANMILALKVTAQYMLYCEAINNSEKYELISNYSYQWSRVFCTVSMARLFYTGKNDRKYVKALISEALRKVKMFKLPGIINVQINGFDQNAKGRILLNQVLRNQSFSKAPFLNVYSTIYLGYSSYKPLNQLFNKYPKPLARSDDISITEFTATAGDIVAFAYGLGIIYECAQKQEKQQVIIHFHSNAFKNGYQQSMQTEQNFGINLTSQSAIQKLITSNTSVQRYLSGDQSLQTFIANLDLVKAQGNLYNKFMNKLRSRYQSQIAQKAYFQVEQNTLLEIFTEIFEESDIKPEQLVKHLLMLSVGANSFSIKDFQYFNLEELIGKFLTPVLKTYIQKLNQRSYTQQQKKKYIKQISALAHLFDITPFLDISFLKDENMASTANWLQQRKQQGIKKILQNSQARARGKGELMMYEMHLESFLENQVQSVNITREQTEVSIQEFIQKIISNAISSGALEVI